MRWTEHYKFPQWQSEDVTTWKGQLNEAFEHLDAILYIIGHQTYASPADIQALDERMDAIETKNEEISSTVEQVLINIGELNDKVDKYKEDIFAELHVTNKLVQLYSLELHSLIARVELLEKEVSRIGSDLVKQYFPCMSGTTLPPTQEEGSEEDGLHADNDTD